MSQTRPAQRGPAFFQRGPAFLERGPAFLERGHALLALLAGGAMPLALAPFDIWPLLLLAGGLCFWVLQRAGSGAQAFWRSWLFGVGKYAVGASWVYVSIDVYGGAGGLLSTTLVAFFVAGLALFHGVFGWLYYQARRIGRCTGMADALLFASLWTALEWALTWVFTGFPWLFAGFAFVDTPLAGLAPVGGVLLVSFAALLTATTATTLATARAQPAPLLLAAAVWLVAWALQAVDWTSPGATRTVALVQANQAQETKWDPDGARLAKERYQQLSAPVWDHDIVFWSEAAIPELYHRAAPFINALAGQAHADLVLGVVAAQVQQGGEEVVIHNAAISTGGGIYRKRRLVPFGEYVPLESLLRGSIAFFDLPMSRTAPGAETQPLLQAGGLALALAICYEIAYPSAVAAQARHADALATISNDTWFGASIGPHQHLQIARMRALENGKYVLRATNNGITAIIDQRGAVVARLPQFEAGVLTGTVRAAAGATPFGRFGNLPVLLIVAVAVLVSFTMPRFVAGKGFEPQ